MIAAMVARRGRLLVLALLVAVAGTTACSPSASDSPAPVSKTGGSGAGGSTGAGGTGSGGTGNSASGGAGGTSPQGGSTGGQAGTATPGTGGANRSGSGGNASGGQGGQGSGGSGGSSPSDGGTDAPAAEAGSTACPGASAYTASILDPKTCLLWQKQANAAKTNVQAAKFCDQLVQDGHSDWRVPAPEEMATWPNLTANSNAYVTNPTYIPSAATEMDGCTGNAHSCNLTLYNAGSPGCGWQGVGFAGPTVCVRGTATPGTTASKFAASNCDACKSHLTGNPAEFKPANCLAY
jgi:hypothetical protein